MKLLVITNLFPNAVEPARGLFNKQQLRELAKRCELAVVAPVPWFPRWRVLARFSGWHRFAQVPAHDVIEGIEVFHPRYLVIPKIGRSLSAWWYFLGIARTVRDLHQRGSCDQILATWAYPDVVAASWIARRLDVPLIAKLHGSDINVLARHGLRRRMVAAALRRCAHVIAVSDALKAVVTGWGIPASHVSVIPNGVDGERFRPLDQAACRRRLGLPADERLILFIGHLVPVKRVEDLLEAFRAVVSRSNGARVSLAMVGDGPLRPRLSSRIEADGFRDRVRLVGARPHEEIPLWMNAADVLCLPSRHEGCPNVVVESLACGRPVVGTAVGGIPALLASPGCGLLVPPCDPAALAHALERSLATAWDARAIRRTVESQTWARTATQLAGLLNGSATGSPPDA